MSSISPRHVLTGGCLLSFGASFVNIGFLASVGVSVSHLTGDMSRLAWNLVAVEPGHLRTLSLVATATLGFIAGATAAGYLLHHPELEIQKPYGRTLTAIGLLLALSHFSLTHSAIFAIFLGSLACGAQNALATRYRGIILRTTHVTGLLTDLGATLGMRLKGHHIESWKILAPLALSLAFFIGSVAGGALALYGSIPWLLCSGVGYAAGGTAWSLIKRQYFAARH